MNVDMELLKNFSLGGAGFGERIDVKKLEKVVSSPKPASFSLRNPRLINRYKLGCDPEFILSSGGSVVSANSIGLTLHAYGADGSGVPVELRVYPSRFAIEVVASVLNTLRFMMAHYPVTNDYTWYTGCYIHQKPIGGHVHISRRIYKNNVNSRNIEVNALHQVQRLLEAAKVFDSAECERRRGTGYGTFGDVATGACREQKYGYEYRVFPSWLMSPGAAHLTLTVAKLAVKDHLLWQGIKFTEENGGKYLRSVLGAYRYMDDDASIAYRGLERTLQPSNLTHDFRSKWGLSSLPQGTTLPDGYTTPRLVEPDMDAIMEVAGNIADGTPLSYRLPPPLWMYKKDETPKVDTVSGYTKMGRDYDVMDNCARCVANLFAVKGWRIKIRFTEDRQLIIPLPFASLMSTRQIKALDEDIRSMYGRYFPKYNDPTYKRIFLSQTKDFVIKVPIFWTEPQNRWLRMHTILAERGYFPIKNINKGVNQSSWAEFRRYWNNRIKAVVSDLKLPEGPREEEV